MRHLHGNGSGGGPVLESLEQREMLTIITATLDTGLAAGAVATAGVSAVTITFNETVTGFGMNSLSLAYNNVMVDKSSLTLTPSTQSPDEVWTLTGLGNITDFAASGYSVSLSPAGIKGEAAGTTSDTMTDPVSASWSTAALPTVQVIATDNSASEFDVNNLTGTITVSRTLISSSALTVKIAVGGTAKNGKDYTALTNVKTVTIPAFNTSTDLTISPIDNHLVTPDQTVVVKAVADKTHYAIDPANASGTVAIQKQANTLSIAATGSIARETDLSPGTFTLTRSGDAGLPLDVYVKLGGTSKLGRDYSLSVDAGNTYDALRGVVTFGAGKAAAVVTLTPINNMIATGTLTATMTVSKNKYYCVNVAQAVGTIYIADAQTSVSIIADQPQATWQGGTGSFTIIRTGSTASAQVVKLKLSGSAWYYKDFILSITTSQVTIPAGSTSVTITVTTPTLSSTIRHKAKTVVLQVLPNGSDYALDKLNPKATVTIADALA
jgi:hypothetical protein